MHCSVGKREEMNKIINTFKLLRISFTDAFPLGDHYSNIKESLFYYHLPPLDLSKNMLPSTLSFFVIKLLLIFLINNDSSSYA